MPERRLRLVRKDATVTASKGWRRESEPYDSSPPAGGAARDDAFRHAPQRGAEFFDGDRTLQLSEEMQAKLSRWIFGNNQRGEMLDRTEIERLRNLSRMRMEQRMAAHQPARHGAECERDALERGWFQAS